MAGFISNAINWASPKISSFLDKASSFLNLTPKYLEDKPVLDGYYNLMKKNTADMMSKYGGEFSNITSFDDFKALSSADRKKIYANFKEDVIRTNRQTNAFNALDYDDFNIGNQKHVETIYKTMGTDDFKEAYFQHQVKLGREDMFDDYKYDFKNLSKKEESVLRKKFEKEYAKRVENFNKTYIPDGANGPNYNYGLQQRYINSNEGRRLHGSFFGDNRFAKKNNKYIKKNKEGAEAIDAYRSYLGGKLNKVPEISDDVLWEPPKSFREFATDADNGLGLGEKEAKMISKQIAMGDPDHSGLGLWQLAKKHPVISTALVTSAIYGVTELTEDDSL